MTAPRKVTRLEDLAALAGVSIATVSRALNDSASVNAGTKRRIWQIAREHNYPFRPSMPAMLSGASATIAIVVPPPQGRKAGRQVYLSDPFLLELLGRIGEAARDSDCDLLISHVQPRTFDDLAELMAANRAGGTIFLGQSSLHDRFNKLAETERRFVVWGAELPGQRYGSVGSDNFRGGQRAAAHLLRLGRRRLAFFGDTEAPEAMQRFEGYRKALDEADIPFDPDLVRPLYFEIDSAAAAVSGLLADGARFDGIIAASDAIAVGAVRGLAQAGVRVPEDVSVVGYDDVLLARCARPALTTVSQNLAEAGRLLVSRLLSANDRRPILSQRVTTELIVRESCGA